jgi:hypothetical protein
MNEICGKEQYSTWDKQAIGKLKLSIRTCKVTIIIMKN